MCHTCFFGAARMPPAVRIAGSLRYRCAQKLLVILAPPGTPSGAQRSVAIDPFRIGIVLRVVDEKLATCSA
jgi:hypothetical protein